jgi:hypothetical protein
MLTITVRVLRNGDPAARVRVVLEYSGLGGMSSPEYTDTEGYATFSAKDGQEGSVFVEGQNVGHWGSYTASDITVSI